MVTLPHLQLPLTHITSRVVLCLNTFGQALDSLKIKSELLQDAKNRTKANIESLLSVTKAVKTGFKALEKTFMDTYKSADNFPQIAKDLLALKPDSTNPNQVLNRLQACVAPNSSSTGGKKQVMLNLYQLKLADCLDDSNILQETQEYAENTTELLNNYTDFETLVRNSQLKCGCTGIIDDYTTPDGNCQSVIYYIELLKRDISQNKSSHKFKNSVGATGQLSVNNFCIDRLQVKFMGDNIEVDPQSKQKASTGIDFSVPNSSNIVLSINVLDEEKKVEKIDTVWKYLGGANQISIEELRLRAFLRMIRVGEGTADDLGYERLFGGKSFITDYHKDWSDHPKILISQGGYTSSAAGAYQVLRKTWDDENMANYRKTYNIPDFSPESQDKFAVVLLKHKNQVLKLITSGKIKDAIEICSYEWASLPPSLYGQPTVTLDDALKNYQKYLELEKIGDSPLKLKTGFLKEFEK